MSRFELRALAGWSVLVLSAGAAGACSGKAVVDGGGGGGSSSSGAGAGTTTSSTSSSGASSSSTSSSGSDCDALGQQLATKLNTAQACEPAMNSLQCTGNTVAYDSCGCTIVVADQHQAEAAAAVAAYDAWVQAGCGPVPCYACQPAPPAPWYCDPATSMCQPAYE